MSRRRVIRTMNLTLAALATVLIFPAAWARAEGLPQPLAPQLLADALDEFARQTGVQVLYNPQLAVDVRSPGAAASDSNGAALRELLRGTGLTYEFVNERTVTLKRNVASAPEAVTHADDRTQEEEGRRSFWDRFRLARMDQGSAASTGPMDQDGGADLSTVKLEEVIVTAQKREERLVDVPISIVVVSGDDLQKRGITRIDDLPSTVPGLSIQNSGLEHRIILRGISNFAGSNSSLIGMYLDEASATSTRNTQLDLSAHDLERVEVLRGPQGTLYGEGSLGGTIRFITRDPRLDRFQVDSRVEASFTHDGGPSQRLETVLNVPLVSDELGVRIAGLYEHDGGWIDQPAAALNNYNGRNLIDIRTKGLWRPSSNLAVSALVELHRNNASTNHGEDANGNYTQVFDLTTTPRVRDDYDLANLTFTYDFSSVRLLSTTTYLRQEKEAANYGYTVPLAPPSPSAPPLQVISNFMPDIASFTDELRLMSTDSGPWQWTVGGYYRRFRLTSSLTYRAGFAGPLPPAFTLDSRSVSRSWALFGDTRYKITDRFSLGAGLRSFRDEQDHVSGTTQSGSFDSVNPRVYAEYRAFEGINTYVSAAKGFRSGGFNNPGQPTYGPEQVWTYELGTKLLLPEQGVSADIALFYSDYKDYQILGQELSPPFLVVTSNGGSARIKGVEWAFDWAPTEQWRFSTNGNYIDSYFYEISVGGSDHAVGDPLDFASRYMFTVAAERSFAWTGHPGFARIDYNQQGPQTFRLRSIGPFFYSKSDVIQTLNFRTGVQWNEHLSLGLFVQNLLDDRGFIDPFAIETSAARARPRTFGVDFNVKFD